VIAEETVMEERVYHTIKEGKVGPGATPIKTKAGWLHIADGSVKRGGHAIRALRVSLRSQGTMEGDRPPRRISARSRG